MFSIKASQESPLILTHVSTEGVKTKYIWLHHTHTLFINTEPIQFKLTDRSRVANFNTFMQLTYVTDNPWF